ncbi:MAG: macro domain-containing protein, partial [Clostridia bacterium]|nr:macro domain-containing protein [Clostridia bacterium]
MDQVERRKILINALIGEREEYKGTAVPEEEYLQKRLLRSLFNLRLPGAVSEKFIKIQDDYLKEATREKGITDYAELTPEEPGIYLWQGDITTLKCGAIVNAANSGMTGCYQPCHGCIDNCIHTYAGVQLRNYCAKLMRKQGFEEPTGQAKIT